MNDTPMSHYEACGICHAAVCEHTLNAVQLVHESSAPDQRRSRVHLDAVDAISARIHTATYLSDEEGVLLIFHRGRHAPA